MKLLGQLWRRISLTLRQREALKFADQFTAESRAHIAALADAGRGREALHENLARLGGQPGQRGRVVSINGVKLD